MFKNKTKLFLVVFLGITIAFDFIFAGIISTLLANDSTRLTNAVNGLATGGDIVITKSADLIFAYGAVLTVGILQVITALTLAYVAFKEGKIEALIVIVITIAFALGLYTLIKGSIRLAADRTMTISVEDIVAGTSLGLADFAAPDLKVGEIISNFTTNEVSEWLSNANWENWMETIFATVGLLSTASAGLYLGLEWRK